MGMAHQPNYHGWGPHGEDGDDDYMEQASPEVDGNSGTDSTGGARHSGSGSGIEMGMELQLHIQIDSP